MRKMGVYEFLLIAFLIVILCGYASAVELQAIDEEFTEEARKEQEIEKEKREQVHILTAEDMREELMCDSMDLLAIVVNQEAGGECELGIRLVIDTVLNRIDHPDFPDTLEDVLLQEGAFTCITDGTLDTADPDQRIFRLILEEKRERTSTKVLYFRGERYADYGTPLFQIGRHYFSGE